MTRRRDMRVPRVSSELFPIVMFWMGRKLSVIEIASMLSIQRAGHQVTLFSYERPDGLPEGVTWRNAAEIVPRADFVFYKGTNPALGADHFRYRLQALGLGLWLDTDILLLKPVATRATDLYGWQDQLRINNAVLYLTPQSPVLKDLIDYTSNKYPVPPFVDAQVQRQLVMARLAGTPVHVSQMPWGVWGPFALTHFVKSNRGEQFACPPEVFYPVHFSEPHRLVLQGGEVERLITDATLGVHLWNNNLKKPPRSRPDVPPGHIPVERGSFFERFCREQLGLTVPELID